MTQVISWLALAGIAAVLAFALWRRFGGLDLTDARETRFASVHECFVRELRPGARPLDPDPAALLSPCDGIVGACGTLHGLRALQAKGLDYPIAELLGSDTLAREYRDGSYVTLRLAGGMYHRFHAPADGRIVRVIHIAGDTWNVNPIALARIERLFCRNERAVLEYRVHNDRAAAPRLLLVAVAAVGVAQLRLHCLRERLGLDSRGPRVHRCDAAYRRGAELGWFEQGSTIIVLAPRGVQLAHGIATGVRVRMGERLMRCAATPAPARTEAAPRAPPEPFRPTSR